MLHVPKASTPSTAPTGGAKAREAAKLPDACGEQGFAHFCGIKPDAPFEYCTVLGLNFDKMVLPTAFSLVDNQGKHFPGGMPVFFLTEKQAKAIKDRAKQIVKTIPAREIKEETGKTMYVEAFDVVVADHLVFEKVSEFRPDIPAYYSPKLASVTPQDQASELKDAVFDAQRNSVKKK